MLQKRNTPVPHSFFFLFSDFLGENLNLRLNSLGDFFSVDGQLSDRLELAEYADDQGAYRNPVSNFFSRFNLGALRNFNIRDLLERFRGNRALPLVAAAGLLIILLIVLIVAAVIFVLVIVAQFVKKLRLLPSILLTCLAFVTILVLPDVDGMIASYNVDAYLDGKLNTVDIASLSELGTSSVPALIRLEKELSKTEELSDESVIILQKTSLVLTRINAKIDTQGDGFFAFNIPDARAKSLLKQRNSDLDG